jgi:hypothetical protein
LLLKTGVSHELALIKKRKNIMQYFKNNYSLEVQTLIIICCIALAGNAFATNKYENRLFSIDTLEGNNIANSQVLMMYLPVSSRFAPNVNIQVQSYKGSLDTYLKLSKQQFKQLKFKIIKVKKFKNYLIFEYTGTMKNMKLHWYSLAYKKKNNIFLATATALESQWSKKSKKLIRCVESFKIK